jgi:hypothetical protein
MSIDGLDTSNLSAGLRHSIDVLWEGREMSAETKAFFNDFENLSPEMQKHWETYYRNLEKAMVSVRKTEEIVNRSKSCFEGGPTAQGSLKMVVNGREYALDGPNRREMLKEAGNFGMIKLAKCRE